jgi:hypothetical protein
MVDEHHLYSGAFAFGENSKKCEGSSDRRRPGTIGDIQRLRSRRSVGVM